MCLVNYIYFAKFVSSRDICHDLINFWKESAEEATAAFFYQIEQNYCRMDKFGGHTKKMPANSENTKLSLGP